MKVGPSLLQLDAHRDIHEASHTELLEATALLRRVVVQQPEQALQVAEALLVTWQSRVIAHAESEEETLYPWSVEQRPELHDAMIVLQAQHDLLRRLVNQIGAILEKESRVTGEVLRRFDALLLIQRFHSEDEERLLQTDPLFLSPTL